jgi:hypothetical protein
MNSFQEFMAKFKPGESDGVGRFGLFAIFDSKALFYANPFVSANNGTAVRAFIELVNRKDSGDVATHPEDFCLYRVGTWDDSKGVVLPQTHINLGLASSFLMVKQ